MKPIKPVTIKKQTDWAEVHRRLEAAATTLERVITPGTEDKKRLLKARAKALSQEIIQEDAGQQYLEVVEFRLVGEVYALKQVISARYTR